jgi:hypothetical protein
MYEHEKLEEAQYFLCRLAETTNHPRAFTFNLSALLSAARSVLQYACKEVKKNPSGKAWYEQKIAASDVIKFLRNKRNLNIHHEPVVPLREISVALSDTIRVTGSIHTVLKDQHGNIISESKSHPERLPELVDAPPVCSYKYRFADWPGPEDLIKVCSSYLSEIKAVVNDGILRGYLKAN